MKDILRFILRLLFGYRAFNTAALKAPGPLLLLPNHVSWLDWLFLGCCLDEHWRFVVSAQAANISFVHRFIMINRLTFPVDTDSPYAVKRMAEHLQAGGKLVIFPEGRLSRSGALMKLFDGTGFLLFKTNAKVITCYLRGARRLPFSPNPNRKICFARVTAHFSGLLTPPHLTGMSTARARQKLTRWLHDTMVQQQFDIELAAAPKNVLAAIVQTARQFPGVVALEDVTHKKLTYRRLLAGAEALAGQWRRQWPGDTPARVGVMLPSSVAMPVTLLSLWRAEKIPAILNFSTGVSTMLACAQLAGLKQIITSKTFLERARLNIQVLREAGIEFIYLEDVRAKISRADQFRSLLRVAFNAQSLIPNPPSEVALVLFTSGSEGTPKGVELTHANIVANVRQLLAVFDVTDADRIFNCLPLFHSFGIIATVLPLIHGCYVFLYPSPLHYRVIPTLIYNLDCTIFIGTNTFLNGYARKANPFDFRSLRLLLAAAEKLQEATANSWARQFGVRVLEGYGATECSPTITVNTPTHPRFGTAGRFLPGIEYRFEPVEGVAQGGRLWVRGPNLMRGYLNPEANEKFLAGNGWYDTGDIASVDEDGFLQILGRLKRFAKVSGEMVSLTAAEEALAGAFPQYGLRFQVAVLARPDPDRGECLVAVANDPRVTLEELRAAIRARGLSNLYVPREIKYTREIPKLGTGKLDHRALQELVK
ncbi:MAG: AMP-binding protein [Verrucomicrobiota bacterium]|jgi:acyl-[acyl-carrier-protein]-phospholipid O-acyltransferase/long-chain-fatty-acid--[acyl-carrier-protein] ligase